MRFRETERENTAPPQREDFCGGALMWKTLSLSGRKGSFTTNGTAAEGLCRLFYSCYG